MTSTSVSVQALPDGRSAADCWQVPFAEVRPGDRFTVLTDDAMDAWVLASAVEALEARDADVRVVLFNKLPHHCADPPPFALAAAKEADVVIALTSTALNSGTPGLRAIRSEGGGSGKTPIWLMEQLTRSILTEGGGTTTVAELEEICDLQARIGAVLDRSTSLRVTSPGGSDLIADISGMPPGYFAARWGRMPFERDLATGRLGGGTWPFGEIHAEPVPGSATGRIVWDVTGHHPEGVWRSPVSLTMEKGRVVSIDGDREAEQVRDYLERFGDKFSMLVGGEIAIGTNRRCPAGTTSMRSEKKRYGAMHFGIGHGADRGVTNSRLRLEGIVDRPTVVADDSVICEDGRILV